MSESHTRDATPHTPVLYRNDEGDWITIRKGIGKRQCTRDFKILPVRRKVKELCGIKRARPGMGLAATLWIGISADEAHRAKLSEVPWIANRHPLLERDEDRLDCLDWLDEKGYPHPPRSACIWCPFRDDESWMQLSREEFAIVAAMEPQLQMVYAQSSEFKGQAVLPRIAEANSRGPVSAEPQTGDETAKAVRRRMPGILRRMTDKRGAQRSSG